MNWFKRNSKTETNAAKKVVTVGSIEEKLSNYRPKRRRAVFEGPQLATHDDIFEFKKVAVDLNSSGIHHIPFTC